MEKWLKCLQNKDFINFLLKRLYPLYDKRFNRIISSSGTRTMVTVTHFIHLNHRKLHHYIVKVPVAQTAEVLKAKGIVA